MSIAIIMFSGNLQECHACKRDKTTLWSEILSLSNGLMKMYSKMGWMSAELPYSVSTHLWLEWIFYCFLFELSFSALLLKELRVLTVIVTVILQVFLFLTAFLRLTWICSSLKHISCCKSADFFEQYWLLWEDLLLLQRKLQLYFDLDHDGIRFSELTTIIYSLLRICIVFVASVVKLINIFHFFFYLQCYTAVLTFFSFLFQSNNLSFSYHLLRQLVIMFFLT